MQTTQNLYMDRLSAWSREIKRFRTAVQPSLPAAPLRTDGLCSLTTSA